MHLCRAAGNAVWSHVARDAPYSSVIGLISLRVQGLRFFNLYLNIPIAEQGRDKSAFVTRRGCYRYTVMPLGMT